MRLRLGQELWITADGELVVPWVTSEGRPMRGATVPTPRVLEKGSEIDVVLCSGPANGSAGLPTPRRSLDPFRVSSRIKCTMDCDNPMLPSGAHQEGCEVYRYLKRLDDGVSVRWQGNNAELLAALGHAREQNLHPEEGDFIVRDLCGCHCKGCGTGWHCHDHRCFPLSND